MRMTSKFWRGFLVGTLGCSLPLSAAITTITHTIPQTSPSYLGITDLGTEIVAPEPITEPEYKPLRIRYGCRWGKPGSHPFTGDVYSALRVLGVDHLSAIAIAERIKSRDADDVAVFSNAGVRDSHHTYLPSYDMAFGNSICFGTRTNFKEGHYELAPVYRHGPYTIAVPDVCGNVTRLGRRDVVLMEDTLSRSQGLAEPVYKFSESVHELPEPATLPLILAGLFTLWRRIK